LATAAVTRFYDVKAEQFAEAPFRNLAASLPPENGPAKSPSNPGTDDT
jgi:hypothetical protein